MMPLTSPQPSGSRRDSGSLLRLLFGIVLFLVALVTAAFGFLRLIAVLDQGGYGTSPMRNALVILGIAGACLAIAIATLIWDVAKRYER
jgi:hypothetical protein